MRASRRAAERGTYKQGIGFGALTFLTLTGLGFGTSILIARVYGIEVIGQYALALAPGYSLALFSTLSEQAGLVRQLATLPVRAPRVTALFLATLSFSFVLTALIAAIVATITWFVFNGPIDQPDLFVPALAWILGYVLFENVNWNYDTVLSSFRAGRQLYVYRVTRAVSFVAIAIPAGFVWGSVWGLIGATIGSLAIGTAQRLRDGRRYMTARVSRGELRSGFAMLPTLIAFGVKMAPGRFADGISNQMGTWVIGAVAPLATVGAWNRAATLSTRLEEASSRINEMLLPTMLERDAQGDSTGTDRSLVDTIRYGAVGMLLLAAVGGGAAEAVMSLFGPGFDQATTAFAIIILVPALATLQGILTIAMVAKDRPLLATGGALARMIVTLPLTFALTIWIGITGTAIAVVIGLLVASTILMRIAARQLSGSFLAIWPIWQIGALALAYGAGFASARVVNEAIEGVAGLAPAAAAGAAGYILTLLVTGGVNDRDRTRLAGVRADLRRRRALRGPGVPKAS